MYSTLARPTSYLQASTLQEEEFKLGYFGLDLFKKSITTALWDSQVVHELYLPAASLHISMSSLPWQKAVDRYLPSPCSSSRSKRKWGREPLTCSPPHFRWIQFARFSPSCIESQNTVLLSNLYSFEKWLAIRLHITKVGCYSPLQSVWMRAPCMACKLSFPSRAICRTFVIYN